MDKKPEVSRAKLQQALEALHAADDRLWKAIAEFEDLLSESQTPGQAAKAWLGEYGRAWTFRYRGEKFIVANWAKDMAIAKRLLAQLDAAELLARAKRFLADTDPFYVKARHPLGLFATNVNRYGTAPAHDDDFLLSPPVGCKHQPPCTSDVAHTKRLSAELRS